MKKEEFRKLNFCLELLAIKDIITERKKDLKIQNLNFRNPRLYDEEIEQFIEMAEKRKNILKDFIKDTEKLNYNNAIKFAQENKEKYSKLSELNHANHYSSILFYIRNQEKVYLDLVENTFRKVAKEIFEELVQE